MLKNYILFIKHSLSESLYLNAIYLIIDSNINTILGFIFAILLTHRFSVGDVGFYSAIVSAAGLLAVASRLGFDVSLIRFLPISNNPAIIINTCFTIGGFTSIIISLFFLYGLEYWSPALLFIRKDLILSILFILITLVSLIYGLCSNILVSRRFSKCIMIQDSINNIVKISVIYLVTSLKLLGLIGTYTFALFIGLIIALIFVKKSNEDYKFGLMVDKEVIKKISKYSSLNYFISLLTTGQSLILPLLVINVLGSEEAAYFYIAWGISQVVFVSHGAISTSLFAEGSNDPKNAYKSAIKSLKFVYLLLVPISIFIYFFGHTILNFFGKSYGENALNLLYLFTLSSFPYGFLEVFINLKKIERDLFMMNFCSILSVGSVLILSYFLMKSVGLIGVGLGWLIAKLLTAIVIFIYIISKNHINKNKMVAVSNFH